MNREELIFEIHKASPMYAPKKLREMSTETLENLYKWSLKPAKVVKDTSDYDSHGNRVEYEEKEVERDLIEPYDPSYLSGTVESTDGNPYRITKWEKRFLQKVSILQNKLRRAKVSCEWDERLQCFRVARYLTEYPTYRYVRVNVEENDYSFGTEKEDLVYDERVSEVVKAVADWAHSKLVIK